MNPLDPRLAIGTIGELLVILRLLEYDVQACFTLKDTGNDLIAIKAHSKKAIQVKTSTQNRWECPEQSRLYDILALISLIGEGKHPFLDQSKIYLLSKEEVGRRISISEASLNSEFLLTQNRIEELFT